MFDLEQAIADWRQQMLAAGIKSPVPLEELENHLREEIERQVKLGLNEGESFRIAVQNLGSGNSLKMEFTSAAAQSKQFGDNNPMNRMKRKIGMIAIMAALLVAALLHFAGAPLAGTVRLVIIQGPNTTIDNSWQIQWYSYPLTGILLAGIVLVLLPGRATPKKAV